MDNKVIDKFTLLQEMCDEMGKSISNLMEVKDQQELLIKVVSESKEKDSFKDFIKESQSQLKQMNEHLNLLKVRHNKLTTFINEVFKKPEMKDTILLLLDALGVFDQTR